jgi:hypothetical protein
LHNGIAQRIRQCQGTIGFGIRLAFAFDGLLRNKIPPKLAGAVFKPFLKYRADGGFVFDTALFKLGERIVFNFARAQPSRR